MESYTVQELKDELHIRNLPMTGNKRELFDRLQEHISSTKKKSRREDFDLRRSPRASPSRARVSPSRRRRTSSKFDFPDPNEIMRRGRSPGRQTTSPGRRGTSPARRATSPGRTTTSPSRRTKSPTRSPGRSPARKRLLADTTGVKKEPSPERLSSPRRRRSSISTPKKTSSRSASPRKSPRSTTEPATEVAEGVAKLHHSEVGQITLFRKPLLTLRLFVEETVDLTLHSYPLVKRVAGYPIIYFTVVSLLYIFFVRTVENVQPVTSVFEGVFVDFVYWTWLGILSSVGLGTGLHTFVLFLGPEIAKTTYHMTNVTENPAGFWDVYALVWFWSLSWGFGTAIGELPPYFVARAERLSGKKVQELTEMDEEQEQEPTTLIGKIKKKVTDVITSGQPPFYLILLLASVPNPLFDLAGLTCGHSLTPFWTFFGATMIGKAIFKANLQTVFVIIVSNHKFVEAATEYIKTLLPSLGEWVGELLKSKENVFQEGNVPEDEESILGMLWNYFIMFILLFFCLSVVNSLAQRRFVEKKLKEKSD